MAPTSNSKQKLPLPKASDVGKRARAFFTIVGKVVDALLEDSVDLLILMGKDVPAAQPAQSEKKEGEESGQQSYSERKAI